MKYFNLTSQRISSVLSQLSSLFNSIIILITIFLCFTLMLFLFTPLQHTIAQITLDEDDLKYSPFNITFEDTNSLRNQILTFYITGEELDDSVFSEFEIEHYEDVKQVLLNTGLVFLLLIIYSISYYVYMIKNSEITSLIKQARIAQYILIGISLFIVVFFDFFWLSVFHELFFNGGYMILEPQFVSFYLFSHEFFMILILIITMMTLLSLEGLKYYLKCKKKRSYS
ncbi:MAG: DUF1461 domain-containing protein [Candidatus Nanoarchaeia archaeon]